MGVGAVVARIIVQYSDKGTKAAQKDIAKLGANFDKFAKRSALAFAAATAAVGAFAIKTGKDAVQAAMDDQKSMALLASTIKNTTGATDTAIAAADAFVVSLQNQFKVTDDELRPALGALVRATGDVAKAQGLLQLALDVSAGSGNDLQAVALGLGKAYNGNFGALTRLGISLDAATLKSKDANKIFGVLSKTFKDQADIRAKTLEYRLKGVKIAYGEILETLGYALLPVVEKFADVVVNNLLPKLQAWVDMNKDKIAAGLDTLLTQIPAVLGKITEFFGFIERNLKTLEVLGGLLITVFATAKVYSGILALTGAIGALTTAFGLQAAAATTASIATALATAGASVVAATAAIVIIKALTKQTAATETATAATTDLATANARVRDSYEVSTKPVKTILDLTNKTAKLTAKELKDAQMKILSEKELAKLKAMGINPTTETDPIQLEAVRLNLIKEQNLAQLAMYDKLIANADAQQKLAIAAQRYADILMVINDNKITDAEINLLAGKWGLTNIEVAKYLAAVTGNVNLGAGWDAAGLAAGDGWKKALQDLNDYLKAVGAASFVAPKFVPPVNEPVVAPPVSPSVTSPITDSFNNATPSATSPSATMPSNSSLADYGAYRAGERSTIASTISNSSLADYGAFRAGERSTTVNVTVQGSVTTSSDLTETVRNGILAGQTSGRAITARVLDL
jgi:hypothetical protein